MPDHAELIEQLGTPTHDRLGARTNRTVVRRRCQQRRDAVELSPSRDAEQILEIVEMHVYRPQRDASPARDLSRRWAEVARREKVEQRIGDGITGRRPPGGSTIRDGSRCHDLAMYGEVHRQCNPASSKPQKMHRTRNEAP